MLAAGATFAVVTLPLSLNQSIPRWVALGALQRQDVPVPERSTKPVIRYIGLSIVASVGVGVAAAEVLRRWQKRPPNRAAHQAFQLDSTDELDSHEPDSHELDAARQSMAAFEALSADALVPSVSADEIGEAAEVSFEQLLIEAEEQLEAPLALSSSALAGSPEPATVQMPTAGGFSGAAAVENFAPEDWCDALPELERLGFPEQVLPLHVRLPVRGGGAGRITFAIAHRGSYYCLVRTTCHLAVVEGWIQALSQAVSGMDAEVSRSASGGDAAIRLAPVSDYVLTQQEDVFSLWQRQPTAVPLDQNSTHNLAVMPQRPAKVSARLAS